LETTKEITFNTDQNVHDSLTVIHLTFVFLDLKITSARCHR